MSEGGMVPPIIMEIRAKAGELYSELGKVKTEVRGMEKETQGAGGRMSTAFNATAGAGKALTFGIGGAALAVGGFAVKAAMSAQVVDAKLRTAITNAGGSMEKLDPQINALDSSLRKFGFTNDQTNTALASATVALKDPAKAMQALSVAADLARAKNISLSDATMMVVKGMEGQTRPLKALGIDLPVYAGNAQAVKLAQLALANAQQNVNDILAKTPGAANASSKAHAAYEKAVRSVDLAQQKLASTQSSGEQILTALKGRVNGAAAAYGDTLQGKVASAKAGLEAMGESLGQKLIPKITDAITVGTKFVGFLTSHTAVLYTVAGLIGGVVVVAITSYIASLVAAAAQSVASFVKMGASAAVWAAKQAAMFASSLAAGAVWIAEHAVMAASYIAENIAMAVSATAAFIAENAAMLGIGLAIAVLVAAVVWMATHWHQVWNGIKAVTSAVWGFLENVFHAVVNTGLAPIRAYLQIMGAVYGAVWDGIKTATSAVWNFLKDAFNWIVNVGMAGIRAYLQVMGAVWGAVWGGIKDVVGWVWGNLQTVWAYITGGIDLIRSGISALGGIWSSIWNGIKGAVADAWNMIQPIINMIKSAVSDVSSVISGVSGAVSSVGKFFGIGGHAEGGLIRGPGTGTSDSILARVSAGEYIVNAAAVNRVGPGFLDMVNKGGLQKLSGDLLTQAGTAAPAPAGSMSQQALTATPGPSATSGGGPQITVNAQTNADPHQIAAEVGWILRQQG